MALTLLIENGVPSVHVNAGDTDPSVLHVGLLTAAWSFQLTPES